MPDLNATTNAISSMPDGTSWFPIAVITILCSMIVMLIIISLSGLRGFSRVKKALLWLGETFFYFLFGIAGLFVLSIPVGIIYYFERQAVQGNYYPLQFTGIAIIIYIVVCLIGWIVVNVLHRYQKLNKLSKKKEKKE